MGERQRKYCRAGVSTGIRGEGGENGGSTPLEHGTNFIPAYRQATDTCSPTYVIPKIQLCCTKQNIWGDGIFRLVLLPQGRAYSRRDVFVGANPLLSYVSPQLRYRHCIENPIYVFPEMKLCGLVPNSYIHVSVNNLYIPRIGLIWLQQNRRIARGYI